jgi:hypothetical protein
MRRNHPTPDHQRPGRPAVPDMAATASPAPALLSSSTGGSWKSRFSWSGRERLRCLWYRLRLTVAEMNYATRRTVELQAPWIADPQWHTKTDPSRPR